MPDEFRLAVDAESVEWLEVFLKRFPGKSRTGEK